MIWVINRKKMMAAILGTILLGCGILVLVSKMDVAATGGKGSADSEYEQLLVRTYLHDMQAAIDNFYDEYFTIAPKIEYFNTYIKDVIKQNGLIEVTFIADPFIGPHDTVGTDEITFTVDFRGDVELKKYNHVVSYSLPENLSKLSIKPIPGNYE